MNSARNLPAPRAKRPLWAVVPLLLALLAPLFLPGPALAAKAKADPTPAATPADGPVARFQTLLARKQATPAALRKLEGELEAARTQKPDGAQGAKAQFFLARVQEEIAKKSGARADWQKSEESFGQYLERFPKHILVAEALVKRGYLRLYSLGDPDGALEDFRAVLKKHAAHPRAALAKSLAAKAEQAKAKGQKRPPEPKAEPKSEAKPDAKAEAKATPPNMAELPPPPVAHQKPRGAGAATLVEMRYKTASDYSRVVLDADAPVRFKYQLIDASGNPVPSPKESGGSGAKGERPRRLYIDLMNTHVGRNIAAETKVSGGMLKSLRASQKDPDTTRIVLEVTEFHDYKVFALENPFRLVVDVYGAPTQRAKAAPEPAAADEEPDDAPAPQRAVKGGIKAPKGSRARIAADLVEQLGLTVHTIMVDAGHGGKDPGAQGFGLMEKDVNLRMALILGKELKSRGFKVVYTRTTDDFIPLEERTARANVRKVDLFVSLHCNAHHDPGMSGLETYSLNLARTPDAVRVAARENAVSDKSISDLQMILTDLMLTSKIKESLDLARGVQKSGLSNLRQGKFTVTDHGNREAPFYVLMGAKMPSILVEIGYITNKTEAGRLKSDYYLRTMARGIADGVVEYKNTLERHAVKK